MAGPDPAPSLWNAGTVDALSGLVVTGNTLIATGGTGSAVADYRTVAFPFTGGTLISGGTVAVVITQAGTLLAAGASAYIPTPPASAAHVSLSTIHNGTVTAQGTIAIATSGSVTYPAFGSVVLAAGDAVEMVNQPTADTALANPSFSLPFRVT
jgi:hypothetical protein